MATRPDTTPNYRGLDDAAFEERVAALCARYPLQGENPAVYGGRESDTASTDHRRWPAWNPNA